MTLQVADLYRFKKLFLKFYTYSMVKHGVFFMHFDLHSFIFFHSLRVFFFFFFVHQRSLVGVNWILSDSKSTQDSRTLLSILADLSNAVVWMFRFFFVFFITIIIIIIILADLNNDVVWMVSRRLG